MGAHYERLTATDTTFLRIETAHEPQHVGSLSVIDGGPLRDARGRVRIEELRDRIDGRLHRVPRLRQRLMEVPFGQGRPVWVDDERFDVEFHVRLTALPRPGDDEQLRTLMGRLQSLPLDRARPLWEMWFVDGLDTGDVALIMKTHHALGDGIANVDLALALVDLEPTVAPDPQPPEWRPRPSPSPSQLLAESIGEQLRRPSQIGASVAGALRDPRAAWRTTGNVLGTATAFFAKPDPAPWNRPVSPHRRWVHAELSLPAVKAVRARHAVTVNDVVLASCTGALRTYLLDRDESVDARVLKAMVPVSVRADGDHGGDALGNLVSVIVVDLPVDEADPVRRLRRVHDVAAELKGSGLVDGADRIVRMADGITPLAAPLTRLVSKQIPMNLVITNIPGPPVPLYIAGAELRRIYPYVEVIDDEGLTIAVVSYGDRMFFGITADRDVMPDLEELARSIEQDFAELDAAGEG